MKEKVLLGKWSAIAMLELQRIPFAGWALVPTEPRCFIRKWVNPTFPDRLEEGAYHIVVAGHTEIGVDRQGYTD